MPAIPAIARPSLNAPTDVRIALVGPARLATLAPHLDIDPCGQLPAGLGGTPVTQLTLALLQAGHDVLLVTLDPSVRDEVVLDGAGLRVRVGPYRASGRSRDAFRAERQAVTAALRGELVDVVHAHWSYEYALGALRVHNPTIVTVRDWAPTILRLTPNPYRFLRLGMNLRALQKARHFTVTSPYMHERLSRWVGGTIPVIPNALDDRLFSQPRSFPTGPATFLAVNDGFSVRKNVQVLLRAFSVVRARLPSARLELVGKDHGYGDEAHRWAAERELDVGVEFVGPVDHAEVMYRFERAHALVHPALEESFGMVLVESMSQGTPVIGGRRSGAVPWVLGDGRAGVLVDVQQPADVASAMIDLVEAPQRWEHWSGQAFSYARERFATSAVVDAYTAYYRDVIDSP